MASILYDTLLSLSDEIEYIWRRSLSIGSMLYILTRYGKTIQFLVYIPLSLEAGLSSQVCPLLDILLYLVLIHSLVSDNEDFS
jgi:hypothetical protein